MSPSALHRLRHRALQHVALAWFALSLLVAVLSPMVLPGRLDLICAGVGGMKLVAFDADGAPKATSAKASMDCALCAPSHAPPPAELQALPASQQALAVALQAQVAAHLAWVTARPPPARGPPTLS